MSAPYALFAEFERPEALVDAIAEMKRRGFTEMEAYTPMPIEGMEPLQPLKNRNVDLWALGGAIFGLSLGMAITVGQNVLQYPLNIGGRPLFSWPAFMVPSFELGVLFACTGAVIGLFRATELPRLHHPVFEVPGFARASEDRFFLCVYARDPNYGEARAALETLDPATLYEAPA